MKNNELPNGFIQQFIAHTNPIKAEPCPPIIQHKEDQTLMSHCLKQFIKQRMYGNLINYSRRKNSANENVVSIISLPKIKTGQKMNQRSLLDIKQVKVSRKSTFQNENRYQQSDEKNKKIQILTYKKRPISSLEQINVKPSKKKYDFTSQILGKGQENNKKKKKQRNQSQVNQINNKRSFLSAIEDQQYIISKGQENENMKQMKNQRDNKGIKQETKKRIKQFQAIIIEKDIWQKFCGSKQNLNTIKTEKKEQKQFSSKSNFSKEVYLKYLSKRMDTSCLPLTQAYNFFQINKTIKDRMSIEDYKKALRKMIESGQRVWAVFAFRYWDKDKNGQISSNDLFQAYKQINDLKTKTKQNKLPRTIEIEKIIQQMDLELKRLHIKLTELNINQKGSEDQVQQQNSVQKKPKQIYLQQSLLQKQRISYKDLEMILGTKIKDKTQKQQSSVIQQVQTLGVKVSSCYRYSFMATDHNEFTRQNRQNIEKIKQELKKKCRHERNESKTDINRITYLQFLRGNYFLSLKNQIKKAFGIREKDEHSK